MARRSKKYFDRMVAEMAVYMKWTTVPYIDGVPQVGAVYVDYYKYGGGYRLCRIANPRGGETCIGVGHRLPAKQFEAWLMGVQWAMGYCSSMLAQKIEDPHPYGQPAYWHTTGENDAKLIAGQDA